MSFITNVTLISETIHRDRDFDLYGEGPGAYEEIGPHKTGNALNTIYNKLSDSDSIEQEFDVSFKLHI